MSPTFQDALAALDAGDAARLRALLAEDPALVRARVPADVEDPDNVYSGYFHGATLLHHVAGNPVRGPLPPNTVALADALLDAGADVDADCGGGPQQPDTGGGTVLGLAASSGQLAESGQAPALLDRLLERGATWQDDGGLLFLALYHTVECRAMREVGEHLRAKGCAVDLFYAAALGELATVRGFLDEGGAPRADAAALWASRRDEAPAAEEVLTEALGAACANGRDEVVAFLLDRGARGDAWTRFGPFAVTPLHCAGWAGWPTTCALLLDRGVDATRRDATYGCTALGWAAHGERAETMAVFTARPERLDLIDAMENGLSRRAIELLGEMDPNAAVGPGSPGVLLRVAAWGGQEEIVRFLLSRGADPRLAGGPENQDAVDVARERGFDGIVRLLEEAAGDRA